MASLLGRVASAVSAAKTADSAASQLSRIGSKVGGVTKQADALVSKIKIPQGLSSVTHTAEAIFSTIKDPPNIAKALPGVLNRRIPIIGKTGTQLIVDRVSGILPKKAALFLRQIFQSSNNAQAGIARHAAAIAAESARRARVGRMTEFISAAATRGFARTERYEVLLIPPQRVVDRLGPSFDKKVLSLFCDEASLPGLRINTRVNRYNGLGVQRAHTLDYNGDGITFSFYVESGMMAKKVMEAWMETIINPVSHEVEFYHNYVMPIEIHTYDSAERITSMTTLVDAFPRAVQTIPISYASPGIMKVQVTFAFKRWQVRYSAEKPGVDARLADANVLSSVFGKKDKKAPSSLGKNNSLAFFDPYAYFF